MTISNTPSLKKINHWTYTPCPPLLACDWYETPLKYHLIKCLWYFTTLDILTIRDHPWRDWFSPHLTPQILNTYAGHKNGHHGISHLQKTRPAQRFLNYKQYRWLSQRGGPPTSMLHHVTVSCPLWADKFMGRFIHLRATLAVFYSIFDCHHPNPCYCTPFSNSKIFRWEILHTSIDYSICFFSKRSCPFDVTFDCLYRRSRCVKHGPPH